MTPSSAIAAARRIVANNTKPGDPIEYDPEDGLAVARYIVSLADAQDDLTALAEIAGRATPGEWFHDKAVIRADGGPSIARSGPVSWQGVHGYQPEISLHNGEHIAAFNPETAQRIIARIRMLEAFVAKVAHDDGTRETVTERNAFPFFSKLNQERVTLRDEAQRLIAEVGMLRDGVRG